MALVWIIGQGGLLGSALYEELHQSSNTVFDPAIKINWQNEEYAKSQLALTLQKFTSQSSEKPWKIFWAAGVGTMHSSEQELESETFILKAFIAGLHSLDKAYLQRGAFIFASSAGAIYGGHYDEPINESSVPSPVNAYGRIKLRHELMIDTLSQKGIKVVICRIATLYGFKQKHGKQQGLVAEMVRKALANEVIHIYVPLETMRDYISANNAAQEIIRLEANLKKSSGAHIKIIASGVSTSIAELLSALKRICKRNLRVVTQADMKSTQYNRAQQFKPKNIDNLSGSCNNYPCLTVGLLNLLVTIKKNQRG
jgi:UDP-glucose 4-epimerase